MLVGQTSCRDEIMYYRLVSNKLLQNLEAGDDELAWLLGCFPILGSGNFGSVFRYLKKGCGILRSPSPATVALQEAVAN